MPVYLHNLRSNRLKRPFLQILSVRPCRSQALLWQRALLRLTYYSLTVFKPALCFRKRAARIYSYITLCLKKVHFRDKVTISC